MSGELQTRAEESLRDNVPRATWTDFLSEGDDGERRLTDDEKAGMNEHFAHFMVPPRDEDNNELCPGCGKQMKGGVGGYLLECVGAAVSVKWGLAHGEGFCSGCGWPYRVYHYSVGPIKKLVLGLPYHPAELRFDEVRDDD